jgi:hypothetical protein
VLADANRPLRTHRRSCVHTALSLAHLGYVDVTALPTGAALYELEITGAGRRALMDARVDAVLALTRTS